MFAEAKVCFGFFSFEHQRGSDRLSAVPAPAGRWGRLCGGARVLVWDTCHPTSSRLEQRSRLPWATHACRSPGRARCFPKQGRVSAGAGGICCVGGGACRVRPAQCCSAASVKALNTGQGLQARGRKGWVSTEVFAGNLLLFIVFL